MNPITYTWKWLTNNLDERKPIGVPLQSDINKENEALRKQNASNLAQIGMLNAKLREIEQQKEPDEAEQEEIQDLKKQQKEIVLNKFGDTISLIKFAYHFINDKNFRKNLYLADKDGKKLAPFGDWLITEKGDMLITDVHSNPMSYGRSLNDIIYKPHTLAMQLETGRLLMPYDQDFNRVEDFEDLEINDIIYDDNTQEFRETEEYRKRARELLMEKVKKIREQSNTIQRLEKIQVGMNGEITDLKRAMSVMKTQTQSAETFLSGALAESNQMIAYRESMSRKVANLTMMKAHFETEIESLRGVIKKLLDKFEQVGDKTQYEQALAEVKDVIEWAKDVVPEQITVKEEAEKPPIVMPQPGQPVGAVPVRK